MNQVFHGRNWGYPLVLFVATLFIFSPLIFSETHFKAGVVTSDYPAIIEFAQNMQRGSGDVPGFALAHPLWELLVITVNGLFGISFRMSAFLVTISSILAAALVLYFWMEPFLRAKDLSPWWGVGAAIGLNLITPISLLAQVDRKYSLGYIGITAYNSPTIILLRPFAICILPAIGLIAGYRLLRKQAINWRLILFGFAAPSIIMLAWQFLTAYRSPDQSGIFFFPFGVMAAHSGFLWIKFFLSIVFPLAVAGLYFREASLDIRMVLAWLSFLFGAFYTYFMAEGAPRTLDGNFIWSGQVTLLVLFCVSTLFVLERIRTVRWKAILPVMAWVLHVAYGLVYYQHVFITQKHI